MGLIPQDVVDRVSSAHDVAEVVGRYVTLKATGRTFKALCPFHEEKTASFTVNPDRQSFKCFGCGKGGGVFIFLMEFLKIPFPEAVRMLAAERGIEVPDSGGYARPAGELENVRGALVLAQKMFTHLLGTDEGREARAYLEKRGYDEAARTRFGLGYAPAGWDRLITAAAARKVPVAVLEAAGLVVPRASGDGFYDRFRNRVTFPVRDPQGRVVTFGARALSPEDNPKYLNGPETPVFTKGAMLYALDLARDGMRRTHDALLMEGYTDVLMAHLHGFDRAVAGMGTAFTSRQAALIARHVEQQRVTLVYDGDAAGRAAAEKTLDVLLEEGLDVRVAVLPEGRDVDEILLEEGPPAFQAVLDRALDVFAFRWAELARRHDVTTVPGRSAAARALGGTLARVKDTVQRDFWIAELVRRLGGGRETEQILRTDMAQRAAPRGPAPRTPLAGVRASPAPETPAERVRREAARLDEQVLLAAAMSGGPAADAVARAVGPEDFADAVRRRVYNAVLDFRERGSPPDARALLVRFADDPEAAAELAGLPERPQLAEQALYLVSDIEKRRVNERMRQAGTRARGAQDQEGPLREIADGRGAGPGAPEPRVPGPGAPEPLRPARTSGSGAGSVEA